jgi:hypothetical protein
VIWTRRQRGRGAQPQVPEVSMVAQATTIWVKSRLVVHELGPGPRTPECRHGPRFPSQLDQTSNRRSGPIAPPAICVYRDLG